MSDQKKTNTDIKLALINAVALAQNACTIMPDEVFVNDAFKRSNLHYEFDSLTKDITIYANANSRIVCAYTEIYIGHIYVISTYFNYDTANRMENSNISFLTSMLPAMIPFFQSLVEELNNVKALFDKHYKSAKSGDILKELSKPLLKMEKITRSKMALVQGSDGEIRLYNLLNNALMVSTILTVDNFSKQIADYGNIFREIPKTIINKENEDFVRIGIGKCESYGIKDLEVIMAHKDEENAINPPYDAEIMLFPFVKTSQMVDGLTELCQYLQWLGLHYGTNEPIGKMYAELSIQINNCICLCI